ncbi:MAG: M24 family metallopeptidase [Candidatus Limnocylindrales bacterium]
MTPADDRARWREGDRAARPRRLDRLRQRLAQEGLDAYFGVRPENARYLTGFALDDGEEKVAGQSGYFLVGGDEVVVLADSRYAEQAGEQCEGARIEPVYRDFEQRWPALLAGLRSIGERAGSAPAVRRLAVEAAAVSHATWTSLSAAEPAVELVPVDGWIEQLRAVKEPLEVERIRAACAVADAALARLLPRIQPGVPERELALALEWEMRTNGADAIAFGVACLGGPRAALPHGSPSDRPIRAGEALLFDFGAQIDGYRSDMTRTLFVDEPSPRDRQLYELVILAQECALDELQASVRSGVVPTNRDIDAAARDVIVEDGHGEHFGHGLGHGIGLATHELPSLGSRSPEAALPTPSVFSVEPGVYLPADTGVRIEDLVLFDLDRPALERLTTFPRELTVVGA